MEESEIKDLSWYCKQLVQAWSYDFILNNSPIDWTVLFPFYETEDTEFKDARPTESRATV